MRHARIGCISINERIMRFGRKIILWPKRSRALGTVVVRHMTCDGAIVVSKIFIHHHNSSVRRTLHCRTVAAVPIHLSRISSPPYSSVDAIVIPQFRARARSAYGGHISRGRKSSQNKRSGYPGGGFWATNWQLVRAPSTGVRRAVFDCRDGEWLSERSSTQIVPFPVGRRQSRVLLAFKFADDDKRPLRRNKEQTNGKRS